MMVISYDIQNGKLRVRFSKMLQKEGAIRLQYSVYEVNNTEAMINNVRKIIEEEYAPLFSGGDSVMVFDVNNERVVKYGNAIHRDQDMVWLE